MSYRDQPQGMTWIGTFTAVFTATLLSGALLLLGVRAYLHWSVKDSMQQVDRKPNTSR